VVVVLFQFQHRRTQMLSRLAVRHSPAGCASFGACFTNEFERRPLLAHSRTAQSAYRSPKVFLKENPDVSIHGLSRPIVAEPETASQVYLQSRLGQRTPLEARPPRHGVAVDQTADQRMEQTPRFYTSVRVFRVVCGSTSGNSVQFLPVNSTDKE
jgi:hypothetical protein